MNNLKKNVTGLELYCHICGEELPLLHPHIMVERNDEKGNLICEQCWQKEYQRKRALK